MLEIDELYLAHSKNGQRMTVKVLKHRVIIVNRKRFQCLMQLMGVRSPCSHPKSTTLN
jgi:hypothetical protein